MPPIEPQKSEKRHVLAGEPGSVATCTGVAFPEESGVDSKKYTHVQRGEERWLPVPGEPRYEVSDHGRVRKAKTGRLLKPYKHNGDYQRVDFASGDRWFVHELVLTAFVGPRPDGMVGRHVQDPTPSNNVLWNLAWGMHKQNSADRRRHGTQAGHRLQGRSFGSLFVIGRYYGGKTRNAKWLCTCACGGLHVARGDLLLSGRTSRCRSCAWRRSA